MPTAHEQCVWYFGQMSTHAAERLLMEKAHESVFVLRQPPNGAETSFVLSVRGASKVHHLSIVWHDAFEAFSLQGKARFPTLQDLVRHFRKHPVLYDARVPLLLGEGYGTRGLTMSQQTQHQHGGAQQRRRLYPLKKSPHSLG